MNSYRPEPDWMSLTDGQADFWEEYRAHPDCAVSTVAHVTTLTGPADEAALALALQRLSDETDVFALRFRAADAPGDTRQTVDPGRRPLLKRLDLRGDPDAQATARAMMQADIDRPLNLTEDPLAAMWLLQIRDDCWMWYCRGHHIFLDGYSMALIERRAAELYGHFATQSPPGRPLGSFVHHIAEEAAWARSPAHDRARDYWHKVLACAAPLQVLDKGSEDYPAHPLCAGADLSGIATALHRAAEAADLAWPELLILAAALWQWQENGGQDLMVWVPLMSRMGSGAARIPCMALNIMPLRVSPDPGAPVHQVLQDLARDLREMRRHGRYRIEQLGRDYGLSHQQRLFFSPLINVMPFERAIYAGLESAHEVLAAGPGDGFNITITASPKGADLTLRLEADPWRTPVARFASLPEAFSAFLGRLVHSHPATPFGDCLEPLPEAV